MNIDPRVLSDSERVELRLRSLYYSAGYRPYRMSRFEPYDLYAQNRSFIAGDRILTFTDRGGKLMALRPDVTLSIIKNYRGGEQKIYYSERVYRDDGETHELREIPQTGIERIGSIDLEAQCEVLTLAADSLALISPDYLLDIAHVGVLTGLLAATNTDETAKAALLEALRGKNAHRVRAVAGEKGLSSALTETWAVLATLYGSADETLPRLEQLCRNDEMRAATASLAALCAALGTGIHAPRVDFSILSDLRYYNGVVFKGYVPGVYRDLLSGGRYDGLVEKLGKHSGAIGFAVYLDRLPRDERRTDA